MSARWSSGTAKALCFFVSMGLFIGCGAEQKPDPCAGWTCSGHGDCIVQDDGTPQCECRAFYAPSEDGSDCIFTVQDPCAPYACSNNGRCRVDEQDQPYCECSQGYYASQDGLDCLVMACTQECSTLGCCGTRCCEPIPSNAAVVGQPQDNQINKTASGTFDTDGDCSLQSQLGDCAVVEVVDSVDLCVCKLDRLNLQSIVIKGSKALSIIAWDEILVTGVVDIAARGDQSGPGAIDNAIEASLMSGGKGGSNGTTGGNSADPARPSSIVPLQGGQKGQDGCGGVAGGGGGGALHLMARNKIGISGSILAGGGGGQGGQCNKLTTCLGGAGGGSGGSILIEASQVSIDGAIFANGGAGGGGGNNRDSQGEDGQDARADHQAAIGGQGRDGLSCALDSQHVGGDGGQGAVGELSGEHGQSGDSATCSPTPYVGGGGGGGGVGRLRVNSLNGFDCTGDFSPAPNKGMMKGG